MRAAVLTALGVLLVTSTAVAEEADSDYQDYDPGPPERRGGFTLGLAWAPIGFSSVRGYPNDLDEIGEPEFLQSIDGIGGASSIWIGGALRDWFTFGIVAASRGGGNSDVVMRGGNFGVRIEAFPLYAKGGHYRDLGLSAEFGAGGAGIQDDDKDQVADGGAMSALSFGAFYEPWRFWHFSSGPLLQYSYDYSRSLKAHTVVLGLRLALYGVQPRKTKKKR